MIWAVVIVCEVTLGLVALGALGILFYNARADSKSQASPFPFLLAPKGGMDGFPLVPQNGENKKDEGAGGQYL